MPQQAPLFAGSDRAFPSHARLDRYFPSASAEEARARLTGCIERGEGPAVLIGASGSGKSMLLEVLADAFADRFAVAHLANTQICTRRALLQAILHALGLGHRDHEEGDLRLKLVDHLQSVADCPAGALLLIDEAQSLAPRLLEELRVIGNLARRGVPLVRLVLAGSTQLEECLAAPELETLNQRIAARCYLSPLAYDELSQYVRAHIAATGANPDELLGDDAAAAVFEATDGIPRLVNQLCDRAIVLAVAAGATRIDRVAIQNAWSDLHQLPAPWHSP
ncbi:MAG: AAA family ATPase, partial [Planctomycetota bacterium]